ncbi:MAG: T9SS type A sorting domain-containing protein [Sphingobacteriales bacterium JAD_PAG50586_3]|nr:MAG: T9SS type A sorting domain-containing protein [Sphingobacteriales bacterium JAD_PAG50586_3]
MKKLYQILLPSAFTILTLGLNAQGIVNNGANIVVVSGSNIIVSSGGYTNGTNGVINNEGTIKVEGDWTNNASNTVFTSYNSTGIVELNGNTAQAIGGTNPTTFESLTVSGTGVKTLANNNNTVNNILTLDGIVSLNSNTLIVNNNSVAAIQQNTPFSSKHIRGETTDGNSKLQWNIGNAPNGNSYRFPFANAAGDDVAFTFAVTTSGSQSGTGNVTVTTYPSGNDNTPYVSGVGHMNFENGPGNGTDATLDRWWVIDANNYTTKPVSSMTFTYADGDLTGNSLITEGNLKAQRWDAAALPAAKWNAPDYFGGTNTNNGANNTVTVTSVSNYSPWVLHDGTSGSNSPLPITLVEFKGNCNTDNVTINWTTASEANNDYFEVERSVDGTNYSTIAIVDGAGNNNTTVNYSYTDFSPNATGAYYRLRQTDFNGQFETFDAKYIRCANSPVNTVGLYPNPTDNLVNVTINLHSADYGSILVYNSVGQLISNDYHVFDAGTTILPINTSALAQGHYFVDIKLHDITLPVQKLVITR